MPHEKLTHNPPAGCAEARSTVLGMKINSNSVVGSIKNAATDSPTPILA